MRCMRYLLSTIILLLLISAGVKTSAMNTGFTISPLTEEEKNTIMPNIGISPIETEPVKGSISCFDVNDSEMIAIGQSKGEQKTVCIYSQSGIFMYGYTFDDSGAFGVEWDGNDINIYFVRSDLIVTVDRDGNILEIGRVEDTFENNSYGNYLLHSGERNTDHARYYTRNDMGVLNLFAFSHSQLVMEGANGEEFIIYDVNEMQLARTIIGLIVVVALFTAAIVIPIKYCTASNSETQQ